MAIWVSYPSPNQRAGCLTRVCLQVSNIMQVPEEETIPVEKLDGSCRTFYGHSRAPSIHLQIGALLASLASLVFSLHLL